MGTGQGPVCRGLGWRSPSSPVSRTTQAEEARTSLPDREILTTAPIPGATDDGDVIFAGPAPSDGIAGSDASVARPSAAWGSCESAQFDHKSHHRHGTHLSTTAKSPDNAHVPRERNRWGSGGSCSTSRVESGDLARPVPISLGGF